MRGIGALIGGFAALAALATPSALLAADETTDPTASAGAVAAPPAGVPAPADATAVSPAPTAESGTQTTHSVAMRDIAFVPKTITVSPGDTITWQNEDAEAHNAIAQDDTFRTPTIQQGETASTTLDEPGTYPYFCSLHAGMKGTVKVSGGGSGGGGSGGSGSGFDAGGGSSGGGSGSSDEPFFGDPGTPPTGPGTSGSGFGSGASGDPSSLPQTGRDEVWLAIAGAWLLCVGAAIRTAAAARV